MASQTSDQQVRRPLLYLLSFVGLLVTGGCGCLGGVSYLGGLIADDWTSSEDDAGRIASTVFFGFAIVAVVCICALGIFSRIGINLSIKRAPAPQQVISVSEMSTEGESEQV